MLAVLEPSGVIKANFPAEFSLVYVVTLAAHQLTTDLHVTNPSTTDTFTFQALLHTYIRTNTALSTVTPLKGLTYINKLKPGNPEEVEEREAVDVREPADFVYKSAGGEYEVSWGGGLGIEIKATGLNDVVIWNPGKDGKKMADLDDGGW
jgi:glucose-6-phosphate 1-epimerase